MARDQAPTLLDPIRRLIGGEGGCALSNAALLEKFVSSADATSFEVLVWRHGAMVLGVCRRILRDRHEAEDAFQATFLVFARKAGSQARGEEPKLTKINVPAIAKVAYFGVGPDEAKPTVGYHLQIRTRDGSPETAAQVAYQKPGPEQERGRRER